MPGNLVVVAGPSGVGKSTIVRAAVKRDPGVWLSVSATTREPRPGEQDGQDYVFLCQSDFQALRDAGGLLEWAQYSGNLYGTPKAAAADHLSAGRHVLLEIDIQGARQVKSAVPTCSTVFIAPPSWQVLKDRLTSRGTEDAAAMQVRLATAEQEMAAINEFDQVIVNADIDDACAQLLAWIQEPHPQ
ncbi:MAG: guanylate kinase [Actinomycetes bacterium]